MVVNYRIIYYNYFVVIRSFVDGQCPLVPSALEAEMAQRANARQSKKVFAMKFETVCGGRARARCWGPGAAGPWGG